MRYGDKIYCDVSKVYIAPIAKNIAKDIIIKKHYTHAWTAARYCLGIYYKEDNDTTFGGDKLIGVVVYGFPVGAKAPTSVCEGLTKDNVLELTRLYCDDGYGSNIESYVLGQSFRWLKENDKDIKVLISYADNGQGHLGGIYKATNWRYEGYSSQMNLMPNYDISLTGPDGTFIHSRTVFSKWGSNNLEHLKREIGKDGYKEFWRRRSPDKHRYIQIIAQDKKEKTDLLKRMKQKEYPYPKSTAEYDYPIEHHLTYAPEELTQINFW
jgi:hypothetical protein